MRSNPEIFAVEQAISKVYPGYWPNILVGAGKGKSTQVIGLDSQTSNDYSTPQALGLQNPYSSLASFQTLTCPRSDELDISGRGLSNHPILPFTL